MAESDVIKLAFIEDMLRQYGVDVEEGIRAEIVNQGAEDTGELLASIRSNVLKAVAGNQGAAQIIFQEHGRFVDMGAGRGQKANTISASRAARVGGRVPRKIYSPVAYRELNTLIGRLSFGFTQDAIAALKKAAEEHVSTGG